MTDEDRERAALDFYDGAGNTVPIYKGDSREDIRQRAREMREEEEEEAPDVANGDTEWWIIGPLKEDGPYASREEAEDALQTSIPPESLRIVERRPDGEVERHKPEALIESQKREGPQEIFGYMVTPGGEIDIAELGLTEDDFFLRPVPNRLIMMECSCENGSHQWSANEILTEPSIEMADRQLAVMCDNCGERQTDNEVTMTAYDVINK